MHQTDCNSFPHYADLKQSRKSLWPHSKKVLVFQVLLCTPILYLTHKILESQDLEKQQWTFDQAFC